MNRIEIGAVKLRQALNSAFPNSKAKRFTSAIITAAGSGERMGGVSKQLYELNGKPCILYSLRAFQAAPGIDEIVIVARPEEAEKIRSIVREHSISKVKRIVNGGKTRSESVKNGFYAIDPKADLVAVHDGDRPLITSTDIEIVLKDAIRYGAATAAQKMTDTVKRADDSGKILETVPRDDLFTVQTPQIFLTDMYRVSLALALKKGIEVTDDNALAENAGFKVKLSVLNKDNIKMTLPEDAARIERILKERES